MSKRKKRVMRLGDSRATHKKKSLSEAQMVVYLGRKFRRSLQRGACETAATDLIDLATTVGKVLSETQAGGYNASKRTGVRRTLHSAEARFLARCIK